LAPQIFVDVADKTTKTGDKMSNTVTISLQRYLKLLYSEVMLEALEACGVDNWHGIDWAMEQAPPALAALEALDDCDESSLTLEMIENALKA
jgi:hypothetical protein